MIPNTKMSCNTLNAVLSAVDGQSSTPKLAHSVNETARMLSIGRSALYAHIKAGNIRATKCGRRTLFLTPDILSFVELLQKGAVQ